MTDEQLAALVESAQCKKDGKGWLVTPEARLLTLYVASNGASLTVGRVEALRVEAGIVRARTVRGEVFVLALSDLFAGSTDAPQETGRRAGFVG